VRVFRCVYELENGELIKYYIYPPLFIRSTFFLLLTLVAFFLSPEFNNLHGRSMACQAGSLLIMYLCMTVIYLTGDIVDTTFCIITGGNIFASYF
jgi:hypothetical protein